MNKLILFFLFAKTILGAPSHGHEASSHERMEEPMNLYTAVIATPYYNIEAKQVDFIGAPLPTFFIQKSQEHGKAGEHGEHAASHEEHAKHAEQGEHAEHSGHVLVEAKHEAPKHGHEAVKHGHESSVEQFPAAISHQFSTVVHDRRAVMAKHASGHGSEHSAHTEHGARVEHGSHAEHGSSHTAKSAHSTPSLSHSAASEYLLISPYSSGVDLPAVQFPTQPVLTPTVPLTTANGSPPIICYPLGTLFETAGPCSSYRYFI